MTNKSTIRPSSSSSCNSNSNSHLSELFYERETEYYGLTPYALLDRIGSMIVEEYFVHLKKLHSTSLPSSCPFLSETQIAAALTQWSRLVEGTIDKNFELFETYIMKNILAIPSDFPIDKFLEEDCGDCGDVGFAASENDLKSLQDQMEQVTKRLELATIKNKRLKGEIQLLNMQESSLEHFESHLSCIKNLLQQYKIDSFETSMSNFAKELGVLKYMVAETLASGTNYLFAKYDSVIANVNDSEHNHNDNTPDHHHHQLDSASNNNTSGSAYNRILAEMEILSAAQTAQQIETRRKQISSELAEKSKISSVSDFEKFRLAIQKLGCSQ